jgi:diaminopimelate decarboxylase
MGQRVAITNLEESAQASANRRRDGGWRPLAVSTAPAVPELLWEDLDRTAASHGPSFFLADLRHFEATISRLLACFRGCYPKTQIAYSYKSNYLPALIRCTHALGAYSEVVSRFEYEFARGLGIAPDRIIFNGPIKSADDLALAVRERARVNVDSPLELERLLEVARGHAPPVPIGLRCHLGGNTPGSRFGLDLASREGRDAIRAIDASPVVQLASLQAHHSADRTAATYRARAAALVNLHRDALGGRPLEYIDIGGGFASAMEPELAAQMRSSPPPFEAYADAVGGVFHDAYGDDGPGLVLEPGIGVLADAMVFVTRVEVLKELHGLRFAVLDGSVFNVKPLRHAINLPISVVEKPGAARQLGPWDLTGHTCMEKMVDLLHENYAHSLAVGDYVIVRNIGAYSIVLNAPFIRGTPPIVELANGRPGRVLRRASTAVDLLESFQEP